MEWRKTHDNEYHKRHFDDEVLSDLNPDDIVEELCLLAGGRDKDIVLICYRNKRILSQTFSGKMVNKAWTSMYGVISY